VCFVRVQEDGHVQHPLCFHPGKQKSTERRVQYLERLFSVSEIALHLLFVPSLTRFTSCFRSVRPTLHGLVINVDVSHAIVYASCLIRTFSGAHLIHILISYEEMPVLDWACTFLSKFASRHQRIQIQDLERLAENDLKLLKAVLKGVRVTVSVPAGRRPARPIKDLISNVGNYHFMKGDEETTIKVCSIIWLSALLTVWLLGLLR
jgi:hypothetical protein